MTFKESIQHYIANGKTVEAIQSLLNYFKDKQKDFYQETVMHSARFKKANQENRMGLIEPGQYNLQINQIHFALLSLLDQVEEEIIETPPVPPPTGGMQGERKWRIFISYAHEDKAHLDRLQTHLEPLKTYQNVASWNDKEIRPGDNWDKSIKSAFAEANLILILLSADYLSSTYCNMEMQWALTSEKTVIPVILEPCMWDQTALTAIQALPDGAKPISLWENREEAYAEIAKGIRRVVSS